MNKTETEDDLNFNTTGAVTNPDQIVLVDLKRMSESFNKISTSLRLVQSDVRFSNKRKTSFNNMVQEGT